MHLFLCSHTPAPYNDWPSLIQEFRSVDYWGAVDRIFLTLQRWDSTCNKFVFGFDSKLAEYFQETEVHASRSNSSTLARQVNIRPPSSL
jgi:hypothetical protein